MGQGESTQTAIEPRRLSLWLLVAIYVASPIFAWFVLRPGYSGHVRRGAFLLAGFSFFIGLLRIVSPY